MSDFISKITERKNGIILTYKVESLVELKFDPGFRVIREYLSQIDTIVRVNYQIDSQYVHLSIKKNSKI